MCVPIFENFPDNPQCSVHLINKGLTIMGNNATLEWEGTGPSATTVISAFACRLDRDAGGVFMPCKMLIVGGRRGGGRRGEGGGGGLITT